MPGPGIQRIFDVRIAGAVSFEAAPHSVRADQGIRYAPLASQFVRICCLRLSRSTRPGRPVVYNEVSDQALQKYSPCAFTFKAEARFSNPNSMVRGFACILCRRKSNSSLIVQDRWNRCESSRRLASAQQTI
jgi:hypothetical protein